MSKAQVLDEGLETLVSAISGWSSRKLPNAVGPDDVREALAKWKVDPESVSIKRMIGEIKSFPQRSDNIIEDTFDHIGPDGFEWRFRDTPDDRDSYARFEAALGAVGAKSGHLKDLSNGPTHPLFMRGPEWTRTADRRAAARPQPAPEAVVSGPAPAPVATEPAPAAAPEAVAAAVAPEAAPAIASNDAVTASAPTPPRNKKAEQELARRERKKTRKAEEKAAAEAKAAAAAAAAPPPSSPVPPSPASTSSPITTQVIPDAAPSSPAPPAPASTPTPAPTSSTGGNTAIPSNTGVSPAVAAAASSPASAVGGSNWKGAAISGALTGALTGGVVGGLNPMGDDGFFWGAAKGALLGGIGGAAAGGFGFKFGNPAGGGYHAVDGILNNGGNTIGEVAKIGGFAAGIGGGLFGGSGSSKKRHTVIGSNAWANGTHPMYFNGR